MRNAGMGLLRITLLFGIGIIALTMLIVPVLEKRSEQFAKGAGVDRMSVGSIDNAGSYVIRRSVLQPSPGATCIIRADGSRQGNC